MRENIEIVVSERGSRQVKRNLDDIGGSATNTAGAMGVLRNAMIALGGAATVLYLQRQADTYTTIINKLQLVTTSTENLTAVNNELFDVAQRTYAEYAATVELYGKVARASDELGLSQRNLLDITETVNQATAISGADAQTAAGGIRQLGQALGSGSLRGDELISILENMPRVAQAIADGMGVSVGKLRELGAEGALSSKAVADALLSQGEAIDREFNSMTPTIAQSLVVLKNGMTRFIGEMNEGSGAGRLISAVILGIGRNLNVILPLVVGVGVAFAAWRVSSIIGGILGPMIALQRALGATSVASALAAISMKGLQGAVNSLTVAIAANPIGLILVAVTAAIALFIAFKDEIKLTEDGVVSLGDYVSAAFELIGESLSFLVEWWNEMWSGAIEWVNELFAGWGTTVGEVFDWVLGMARTAVNLYIGVWVAAFNGVKTIWNNFPGFMDTMFTGVINLAIAAAELVVNAWQAPFRGIQHLASFVDEEFAGVVGGFLDNFTVNVPRRAAGAAGQQFAADFTSGMAEDLNRDYVGAIGGVLGDMNDAVMARARRNAGAGGTEGVSEDGGTAAAVAPDEADGNKTGGRNGRPQETRAEFLAKLNRETENSIGLARSMNFEWERVDEDLVGMNERLAEQFGENAVLNTQETASWRDKLKAMYDAQDQQDRMRRLYEEFKGPQEDYENGTRAIIAVMREFPQYAEEGERALRGLRIEYLRTKNTVEAGLELGRLQVEAQQDNGAERQAGAYQAEWDKANGGLIALMDSERALQQLMLDDPINSGYYANQLRQVAFEMDELKLLMGDADFGDGLRVGIQRFVQDFEGVLPSLTTAWGNFFTQFADGFANSVGQAIVHSKNLGAALRDVAKNALAELISALVKMALQWLVMKLLGETIMTSQTAASSAAGAATAAAWAPAAAAVSLASFGANAAPAAAGMALNYGLSAALAAVPGFADGGMFRGAGGPRSDSNLALISDGEFIVNAASTAAYLPLLQALNSKKSPKAFASGGLAGASARRGDSANASIASGGGTGGLSVTVEDHVGADVRVQRVSRDEVRVMVREEVRETTPAVVASEIGNSKSKVSKAIQQNTTAERRVG